MSLGLNVHLTQGAAYQAGDVLHGTLYISLKEDTVCSGIKVGIHGECMFRRRGEWKAKEILLHSVTNLLDCFSSPNNSIDAALEPNDVTIYREEEYTYPTLPPGDHSANFNFQIPSNLPSSFTISGARIHYYIRALFRRPGHTDVTKNEEFTIQCQEDLNKSPELLRPVVGIGEASWCVLDCVSSGVTGELRTGRRGVVPGEVLPIAFEVENLSPVKVKDVRIIIRQTVTARAGRWWTTVLCSDSQGEVAPRETKKIERHLVEIPHTVTPGRLWCAKLQVKYHVVLQVIFGKFLKTLSVPVPLTVGTVPFTGPTAQRYVSQFRLASTTPGRRGWQSADITPTGSLPPPYERTRSTLPLQRRSLVTGPSAKELITALQKVRKNARAESLGAGELLAENSSRRNSLSGPADGSTQCSRRSTMTSLAESTAKRKQIRQRTRDDSRSRTASDCSGRKTVK